MQQQLEEYDPCEQLPNVNAILKAYRSGQLEWSNDLVTYWHNGQMVCRPVIFSWDDLEEMSEKYSRMGLWVECVCHLAWSRILQNTDFLLTDWWSVCAASPSEQNHSNRATKNIPGKDMEISFPT